MTTKIPLYKYQMHIQKNENKTPSNSNLESDEVNKTNLYTNNENIEQ